MTIILSEASEIRLNELPEVISKEYSMYQFSFLSANTGLDPFFTSTASFGLFGETTVP